VTSIELIFFTFGGFYVCTNFGENRSENATMRVPTDGHTDRLTCFIICFMQYAVAMEQINVRYYVIIISNAFCIFYNNERKRMIRQLTISAPLVESVSNFGR